MTSSWMDGEVAAGALAGLIAGLLLSIGMAELGVLSATSVLISSDSPVLGLVVSMIVAASFGGGLGLLVARQGLGAGETVLWGLAYGALWWLVSELTLSPAFSGRVMAWSLAAAQTEFSSLIGHLLFGASTGLALGVMLRPPPFTHKRLRVTAGSLLRGGIAGTGAMWLLTGTPGTSSPLLGLIAGAGFALLYPDPADGAGPALIRGVGYGFLLWVIVALTVAPVLAGSGPAWTVWQAGEAFTSFPGYLLAGALTALLHRWLGALRTFLFSDPVTRDAAEEGPGARGLRAGMRGAVAGLVGGLLFTVIMVELGYLGTVAQLVRTGSEVTGLAVHFAISVTIGTSYGLAFRRQAWDATSALGWGIGYGFFWWILGSLTLLPVLLGGQPQWTATAVASAFPSLVGHLTYGAGLGLTFLVLEARSRPWWLTRTEVEVLRVERRRANLQGAPAVWALVIVIALTIPIVLSGSAPADDPARSSDAYRSADNR